MCAADATAKRLADCSYIWFCTLSGHSFFSPSKSAQWLACPGSMAFPANQVDGGSSTFADNGTASHQWSGDALTHNVDTNQYLDEVAIINGATYTMDEERASFCQIYVDDVRRRAMGGSLFVEYRVDLSEILGAGQGGTADAAIILPVKKHATVVDLKYGTGEKVWASLVINPANPEVREINPQLGLYLCGVVSDMRMLGYEIETVTGVICQPRLGHIDEFTCSVDDLMQFAEKAKLAVKHAAVALTLPLDGNEIELYINPGEKQCRWCRNVTCKKRARMLSDAVMAEFDVEQQAVVIPDDNDRLSKMFMIAPFVEQWIKAVKAETAKRVAEGTTIMGSDEEPLKFVEGKEGNRGWDTARLPEVEALLVGQLGPKAYKPHEILTAPAAGKLLDKKATKATWEIFKEYIKRPPGHPVLALGSDPRPTFSGAAMADDFEEVGIE